MVLYNGRRRSDRSDWPAISWSPEKVSPAHGDSDRTVGTAVAVGAVLLAAALGFSASIFPLPGVSRLFDVMQPGERAPYATTPDPSRVAEYAPLDLRSVELPDIVRLVDLLEDLPLTIPASTLLDFVATQGVHNVTSSLELLQTLESLTPAAGHAVFGGGGGGGGSAHLLPAEPAPGTVQTMIELLHLLLEYLTPAQAQQVSTVVAHVSVVFPSLIGLPIGAVTPAAMSEIQPENAAPLEVVEQAVPAEARTFTTVEQSAPAVTEWQGTSTPSTVVSAPSETTAVQPTQTYTVETPISVVPATDLPPSSAASETVESPDIGIGDNFSGGSDDGASGEDGAGAPVEQSNEPDADSPNEPGGSQPDGPGGGSGGEPGGDPSNGSGGGEE